MILRFSFAVFFFFFFCQIDFMAKSKTVDDLSWMFDSDHYALFRNGIEIQDKKQKDGEFGQIFSF